MKIFHEDEVSDAAETLMESHIIAIFGTKTGATHIFNLIMEKIPSEMHDVIHLLCYDTPKYPWQYCAVNLEEISLAKTKKLMMYWGR